MAKFQGLYRLSKGIKRQLNNSEVKRGYIYITNDAEVRNILGTNFDVSIGSKTLKAKVLDNYGRIIIGRVNSELLSGKIVKLILSDKKIILTYF